MTLRWILFSEAFYPNSESLTLQPLPGDPQSSYPPSHLTFPAMLQLQIFASLQLSGAVRAVHYPGAPGTCQRVSPHLGECWESPLASPPGQSISWPEEREPSRDCDQRADCCFSLAHSWLVQGDGLCCVKSEDEPRID